MRTRFNKEEAAGMTSQQKKKLYETLAQDAAASGRSSIRSNLFGDEIWKFQVSLRMLEYCDSLGGAEAFLRIPLRVRHRIRYHALSLKLGYTIPTHVFGGGLAIAHRGTIVVAKGTRAGRNCRIHEGVTIGATNGEDGAAQIGNNVFIGAGAKIIGKIEIADDVAIGANAVVVRSINEPGTTWGGVPAKKISDHSSHGNLSKQLLFSES